jgi:hypothetical protein
VHTLFGFAESEVDDMILTTNSIQYWLMTCWGIQQWLQGSISDAQFSGCLLLGETPWSDVLHYLGEPLPLPVALP